LPTARIRNKHPSLAQFLVAVLVAVRLAISGGSRRAGVVEECCKPLNLRVLAERGGCGHKGEKGL